MKTKTCISVSIDLTDEFETNLLRHAESKGNKSRYIKRLIYADLIGVKDLITASVHEEVNEDEEAMGTFF